MTRNSQSINPLKLDSLKLSELNQLPSCTAIYFAIDANDRILYVGKADNLRSRWQNHHRKHQLQEISEICPIRIAWLPWNCEGVMEAEKFFIQTHQPLLNGTLVKLPEVVPSETIFTTFLKTFSRRIIILGIQPISIENSLPHVHLKYNWEDCSPKGTAAKIKNFIKDNKTKNTSIKFRRQRYIDNSDIKNLRPGSRIRKVLCRKNRSYNNHWQLACNGVIIHITPAGYDYEDFGRYQELKSKTEFKTLAGVRIRAITAANLADIGNRDFYFFSDLLSYEEDIVPLLWSSY